MRGQIMNDPKDLEERIEKLETKVNQDLTIVIGQNWRTEENLRLFRSETSERLTRLDDRISALNQDSAEQLLAIRELKKTQDEILALLKKGN
jgi:uncharacterized coiled-coil protein SlyX